MNEPQPKKKPIWVSFILLGVRSRIVGLICQWFSVALAMLSVYLRIWFGLSLLLAAFCYWLAIRWMDKNTAWPESPPAAGK